MASACASDMRPLKRAIKIDVLDDAEALQIHATTDADDLRTKIVIKLGQTNDIKAAAELLTGIRNSQMVPADRGYDAEWLRTMIHNEGGWANIPPTQAQSVLASRLFAMTKPCIGLKLHHNESRFSRGVPSSRLLSDGKNVGYRPSRAALRNPERLWNTAVLHRSPKR